jgi:hypothetical protein
VSWHDDARSACGGLRARRQCVRPKCPSARSRPQPVDHSLSIRIEPTAPDGFIVHSFAGDSPLESRDYVRAALGRARGGDGGFWQANARRGQGLATRTPASVAANLSKPGLRIRSSAAAAASSTPTDSALRIMVFRYGRRARRLMLRVTVRKRRAGTKAVTGARHDHPSKARPAAPIARQ